MANQHFESASERGILTKAILCALLTLEEEQLLCVWYRYVNALSLAETARLLEQSPQQTQALEAMAIRRLRNPGISAVLRELAVFYP